MPRKPLPPMLARWAAAILGCTLFLLVDLLPQGSISIGLIGQLSWLALLGSIPTTLVLTAASRTARAPQAVIAASTMAVVLLCVAIGWEHTDFLLSGPQWMHHPQRPWVRTAMVFALGLLAAGGWLWLLLGARTNGRRWPAVWMAASLLAIGLLMTALLRYRAYDYSMAQLVFPAGVLSSAIVYLLVRESRSWPVVLGAVAACLLFGIGSRFDPALVATGQREVIAHGRAGALVTLYVLPHLGHEQAWSAAGTACPDPRPVVEQSPIGIEPNRRRNVIVVTVDAVRRDVVGLEVQGRPVTPELTRLAKTGVSFTNATSTYPATLFAMGSAFTGSSPAELYLSPALPDTIFTLSRAHVDRQLAILPDVSWFRLPIVGQFLAPGVGTAFAPTDTAATDLLITQLRAAREDDASIMAWVHYYAPHEPYQSHRALSFGTGKKNAYLSEVAYFDRELGRLMEYLDDDGWLEDTLVVFFSDHGEALGEKSYWGHHVYLNGWMVDVPLVLWHASLASSERHVGASIADVAPTVLHFLGLPAPSDTAAESLFTLDPNLQNRPSFSEAFPVRGRELFDSFRLSAFDDASVRARLRGIRTASKGYEPKGAITRGRYRLIHHRGANTALVYDRELGPSDQNDGNAASPDVSKLLRADLEVWEREQLRRIQCRLQLSGEPPAAPRPE